MSVFVKVFTIICVLVFCLQLVFCARLPRDSGTKGKTSDDLDVKALSEQIMNRLKDNLKNGGDSVKNILNSASNSLQRSGGIRAGMAALL